MSFLPLGFTSYSTKEYPRYYDYNIKGYVKNFNRAASLAFYAGANYKVKTDKI